MCGFIGQISKTGKPDDLYRAGAWLYRRGPDSQRVWSSMDKRVCIAHARLAIVDKDPRSHQPLTDEQSDVTVAFAGEIYNYLELRSMLASYPYSGKSDTEVILALYRQKGLDGLRLLKGMYSLVIVHEKAGIVVLARDPIGKKPLYYARWGESLYFGVSLIPLVAVSGAPVTLRRDSAAAYWRKGFVPSTQSLIQGAVPVLPGEVCVFSWDGVLKETRSCLSEPVFSFEGETPDVISQRISFLVEQSVRRRLANNPSPAVLLSGGIDSTVVTKAAQKLSSDNQDSQPLRVLTLAAALPFFNDEFYARYAAHRMRLPLEYVSPVRGRLADSIMRSFDLQDEPLGMISYYMLVRLVEAVSSRSKVLLTGDGGDEIFCGYAKPSDWVRADGAPSVASLFPQGIPLPDWMSPYAVETVTDTFVGHMLAKADRACAEQGVEIRCPLLDCDLIRYVWTLPFERITQRGVSKALLKNYLGSWPRWFCERKKLGFAYNLRWIWLLQGFAGAREMIDYRALHSFGEQLPLALSGKPMHWRSRDIFRYFPDVWRLLAWSSFVRRLDAAAPQRT